MANAFREKEGKLAIEKAVELPKAQIIIKAPTASEIVSKIEIPKLFSTIFGNMGGETEGTAKGQMASENASVRMEIMKKASAPEVSMPEAARKFSGDLRNLS